MAGEHVSGGKGGRGGKVENGDGGGEGDEGDAGGGRQALEQGLRARGWRTERGKGRRGGKEPEREMERVMRAMQVEGGRLKAVCGGEREGKRVGRVREGEGPSLREEGRKGG